MRNPIFDIMKGIAILFMMRCHFCTSVDMAYRIILTFHMPLFFILGGFFQHVNSDTSFKEYTQKNVRRLLYPYFLSFLIIFIWAFIKSVSHDTWGLFTNMLLTVVWCGSEEIITPIGWSSNNPLWFLVTFFIIREISFFLHRDKLKKDIITFLICIVISICVGILHKNTFPIPFCIYQSLFALPFYTTGLLAHKYGLKSYICLAIVFWILSIAYCDTDLRDCRLGIYPIGFVGAWGGTITVYFISLLISKFDKTKVLKSFLTWCGRCSLVILCIHSVDLMCSAFPKLLARFDFTLSNVEMGVIRGVCTLIFSLIIISITNLKKSQNKNRSNTLYNETVNHNHKLQ